MPSEAYDRAEANGCFRSLPAADAGGLPEDVLEAALAEQEQDWIRGQRIAAEERLRQHLALAADPAQGAQLVYHEFVLRQERGEAPDWDDYLRQFPAHAAWLQQLRQADEIVGQMYPSAEEATEHRPRFRDYEVLEELGHGGMGIVYKARQRSLDRVVAVKMLRAGDSADEDRRKRFRREAEAVARLQHPNIVQIYEVGEAEGQPFLALEFVNGPSLAQHLKGTPLPAQQAASLLETLARAMHYAHEQGIIHRDLKPSNVLLAGMPETGWEGCVPKITDFGLAKRLDKAGDTASGEVLGTPSYMAPEQAEPRTAAVDRRTDVYGLGVIEYEMLTGRSPFRADSPLKTLQQVLEAEPARPRLLNPAVPADLETICLKCLEKEPVRRYATAQGLADDLRRFLSGEPIRARPVGAIERGWRWCRRKPVIAGLAAALLIAVAGGFFTSVVLWRKAVNNAIKATTNEAQALASLANEREARRQLQEQHGMLRQTLLNSIQSSSSVLFLSAEANPIRQTMLREAETSLSDLVRTSPEDSQLCVMLATVLTQLGTIYYSRHRDGECQAVFERAAALWERLPAAEARKSENRAWRAVTYTCLEQTHDRQGQFDLAQQCFERAFHIWQELFRDHPTWLYPDTFLQATIDMRWLVINSGHSEAEVSRRFERIRERLDRMAAGDEGELFLGLARVASLCPKADEHYQAKQPEGVLAAAREAASVLAGLLGRPFLPGNSRLHLVYNSFRVSMWLRMGRVPVEALALSERANRALQELLLDAPNDHRVLAALSQSWYEIGKIRWDLKQTEETLTACRKALEALQKLCSLAPAMPAYRVQLGYRYAELGRKLCELGRLDEAEAYFWERQALWPGDAAKHAEALQDLRYWAAQVTEGKNTLSPQKQQERQRYLDLCARLERKGIGAVHTEAAQNYGRTRPSGSPK